MSLSQIVPGDLNTCISKRSPIPFYVQVKESLKSFLSQGVWKPGQQIPGEPELCRAYAVSRTVIRQTLKELELEGLILREKGRGTFVAEPKISESLVQKLTGFYQDMKSRGYDPVSRILDQKEVPAENQIAAALQIPPGAPVIRIERLRLIQAEPLVWVVTYLPSTKCPGLLKARLSHRSLYELLESQYGIIIARGHRTLEAVSAGPREASLLQVKRGAPLIRLKSVSYLEDGTPIEYYQALHRGDKSRFEVELIRISERGNLKTPLARNFPELPTSN